jgi:hypothetical protein
MKAMRNINLAFLPSWIIHEENNDALSDLFQKVYFIFTRCDVVGTWSREYQLFSSSSSYYQMRHCQGMQKTFQRFFM